MSTTLPSLVAPAVVEALDFETILAQAKADLLARYPEATSVLGLESEPLVKLLEVFAYRELVFRARVNDAARAHLIAYAAGADLDHIGALFGVTRLAGEADERLRQRILLRIAALSGQGTREHYEGLALGATLAVRSAHAMQPEPGHVRVLLWLVAGADEATATAAVLAALNADSARMLGVPVSVGVAQPAPIAIKAVISREPSAPTDLLAQLQARLPGAFDGYGCLGRDVARSWITTLLHVDGVAAVTFPDPALPPERTELDADAYPVLGTVQLIEGGVAQ